MDIMELGAIGELVGGVAVVASLIFVGLQVRQNTFAIRASAAQAFADSVNQVNVLAASHQPRAGRLAFEDPGSMTDDERSSVDYYTLAVCRSFESALLQSEFGSLDPQTIEMARKTLKGLFSTAYYQDWWSRQWFDFTDRFIQFVEDECGLSTHRREKEA